MGDEELVYGSLERTADAAWLTVAMVAGATGLSLGKAKRLLDEMVSDGRAEVVVRKRRRYYRLTEGGAA